MTAVPTNLPTTFDAEGHRGCRGLKPENTIPAMLQALNLGVTTLEMDACISKDKKVFVSHEPFFNHEITTLPNGSFIKEEDERKYNMYEMTYDSIKTYDVGMKLHPRFAKQDKVKAVKPLLADVFDAVKEDMKTRRRPFPFFNIETKTMPESDNIYHPKPEEFVELLMAVIKEKNMEDHVIIQSFDFRTLIYLHKKYPYMKTAMLVEATDKRSFRKQLDDLGFTPTIYSPAYEIVTKNLITESHEKNIRIIPWTVNDKNKIDELKSWGVDGIISDYPNLFNE
jgi:glycerophosphoryl diester phosphodiesterase